MRATAPEWHDALNAGKESVVCDLPAELDFARALLARADVVLESFRPASPSGSASGPMPSERAVYCSITGFGLGGRARAARGPRLNYLGWAGVLAETAPALPPVQVADLAAGALGAVTEMLAALLARAHGRRRAHRRLDDARLACARTAATPVLTQAARVLLDLRVRGRTHADGRRARAEVLRARLCELLEQPELAAAQYDADQPALKQRARGRFARRPLDDWLRLFEARTSASGPLRRWREAAADLGVPAHGVAAAAGADTADWRRELGLTG